MTRRFMLAASGALVAESVEGAVFPRRFVRAQAEAQATPVATTPMPPTWSDLGLMQGFPPPPDKRVNKANWIGSPYIRWAAQFPGELLPSRRVWRGEQPARAFAYDLINLEALVFPDDAGQPVTLTDVFARTVSDGFLVLHRGEVVYETYLNGMRPETRHIFASMTKSVTGTLAMMLAAEGSLDLEAKAANHLPELAGNPLGEATLQQLLDMVVPVTFGDADQDVALFWAAGFLQTPPDYSGAATIYDYLQTARPTAAAGSAFQYQNACPETVGWVIRRVTGKSLATLLAERIWSRLGCEEDAMWLVDPEGTEAASAGLVSTLRDLARFGELLRTDGMVAGTQVLPREVTAQIRAGFAPNAPRLRELFAQGEFEPYRPGGSYHNQWWLPNDPFGAFQGNGRFGQRLYVAPGAEMVVAQFGSTSDFADVEDALMRATFAAIAEMLAARR